MTLQPRLPSREGETVPRKFKNTTAQLLWRIALQLETAVLGIAESGHGASERVTPLVDQARRNLIIAADELDTD